MSTLLRLCLILGCWWALGLSTATANAKTDLPLQYTKVYDIAHTWQVYDDNYQAYVPYIARRHGNTKTASLWLDLQQYEGYHLALYTPKDVTLFINQKLAQMYSKEAWVILPIDSLRQVYPTTPKLFFTIYDQELRLPLGKIWIVSKAVQPRQLSNRQKENLQTNTQSLQNKTTNPLLPNLGDIKNFIGILLVLLLLFYALMRNLAPRTFDFYHGLRSNFSYTSPFESSTAPINILGLGSQGMLLLHSLLLALFFTLGQRDILGLLSFRIQFVQGYELLANFSNFFIASGLIYLLLGAKYALLSVFSLPMNTRNLAAKHFSEYVRVANWFYLICTCAALTAFFAETMPQPAWIYTFVTFHIAQSLWVGYHTNREAKNNSLYLFYYLCITEISPLLIGVKFLLF
ncbi:DUF4271 domain-containing protein [Eisenibacter elegans]|uniref:DUF4271 domain-containing protein n=1 Tax=Eisenibacter elegans TaxID=997 RepID=UPI001B7F9D0D|nr:DUF4271 domain-containing protein [Eisenibacter elegans]